MPLVLSLGTKARLSENGRPMVDVDGAQLLRRDDLADGLFDLGDDLLGFLKPHAARRADVHLEDADVGGREEVGADLRRQHPGRDDHQAEAAQHEAAPLQRRRENAAIAVLHALEAAVEGRRQPAEDVSRRVVVVILEQIARQRRNDRERQHVGRQHRQHDGDGERDEQEARRAGQQQHREEHDADRERRHRQRLDHLVGAVEDRDRQRLAERLVAVDVLDRHRGVVDQEPDGERKTAERHQVDGLAGEEQARDAGRDRQRDRQRHDHGVPPAAEEDQDHQRHQDRRQDRLVDDVVDRALHEHRLVEVELQLEALPARWPASRAGSRAPPAPRRWSRHPSSSGCSCSSRAGR